MSSIVATVENREDSTNHDTVHNANISVNKIYFQIAFYGNIISRLLVSSLVKVLKKKLNPIYFFLSLRPPWLVVVSPKFTSTGPGPVRTSLFWSCSWLHPVLTQLQLAFYSKIFYLRILHHHPYPPPLTLSLLLSSKPYISYKAKQPSQSKMKHIVTVVFKCSNALPVNNVIVSTQCNFVHMIACIIIDVLYIYIILQTTD